MLALALARPGSAAPATTADVSDAEGTDVASVSHSDADGVVRYTVRTFAPVRADQVAEMRWDLDLDGDEHLRGADDACVVLKPVRGSNKLRAGLFEGCGTRSLTSADARTKGQTIKLSLLTDELERAGLDDDAPAYGYRFTSVDRSGAVDVVPNDADGLITHALSGRAAEPTSTSSSATKRVEAAQTATATPAASAAQATRDTTSAGTADETTVEPGDDVDIEGGGFASNKSLKIFLVGNATSTATPSPSPSPTASASASPSPTASASPTPTATPSPTPTPSTSSFRGSEAHSADVVVGQRVGETGVGEQSVSSGAEERVVAAAAADTRVSLGVALSDDEGNFEDEAEIPESTTAGAYNIVVEGPNSRGGTNTVTIPITVAAQVESSPSAPANATTTATQASPVASTVATGGGALPTTGSSSLQTMFGLGLLAAVLGAAMLLAKHVAGRRAAAYATPAPVAIELRGEMQRLLARRTYRHDPDRHTDL